MKKSIRIIHKGECFGQLVALEDTVFVQRKDNTYEKRTLCSCSCGNPKKMLVLNRELLSEERTNCGCSRSKGKLWTWECSFCHLKFRTRADLFKHNKEHHPCEPGHSWNKGKTMATDPRILKGRNTLKEKYRVGELKSASLGKITPPQIKEKISESLKIAHKEKRAHNIGESRWKGEHSPSEKEFKSIIEERFSDKLVIQEMRFHLFSLDFAWPHKKKCIELDGEQHFRFESYRQRDERKNVALAKEGWQIMRIPLTEFYGHKEATISKANEFIGLPYSESQYAEAMQEFLDKETHHRKLRKTPKVCPDCGKEISPYAKKCHDCDAKAKQKIQWPSKEILERMFVEASSLEGMARILGVSSPAIKKRMKKLGIEYVAKKHKGNPENFMTPEARAKSVASTREYARLYPVKMEHRIGKFTKEGELIKIYEYQKELKADGFNRWSPLKVARGVIKSYKGFDWKFVD